MIKNYGRQLVSLVHRFRRDSSGQIAIIFGLSSMLIVVGIGSGIDLSRAYAVRQKLSQAAALTCQYSARPSVIQIANNTANLSSGFVDYLKNVNAFAKASLASQNWKAPASDPGTYFTATQAGMATNTATSTSPTNPVVEMSADVPMYFMQIMHIASIKAHAKVNCQTAAMDPSGGSSSDSKSSIGYLLRESFETPCASFCFTKPDGTPGALVTPTTVTTATPGYTGSSGTQWYILGHCIETDVTGQINATSPAGSHSAELDCDNSLGGTGNSSMSTKVYLAPGHYELRYFYRSRMDYPNYDPAYICGTTAGDVAWANDTTILWDAPGLRTNQANVYLDMATTPSIPLHTTLDGRQQLGGSNLIDVCVYSPAWIERSVKITVTTPAYYWVTFAADGADDSRGAQIDDFRLCKDTCPGVVADSFPTAWSSASNGGVNKILFEDTFESPAYQAGYYSWIAINGNLSNSLGTSGTPASGWSTQPASGWATAPYNQVNYFLLGAAQGTQYLGINGSNTYSTGPETNNRLISRPFLLDPGYYQVSYNYLSEIDFGYLNSADFSAGSGGSEAICTAAPASGAIYPSTFPTMTGNVRFAATTVKDGSSNLIGVFMSHSALVSTPNIIPQNTANSLGATTIYTNPDGSQSTTPRVPPDKVTWSAYDANAVNPVIDTCGFANGFRWEPRSVAVKITKPGFYWLTFSANGGQADGKGPSLDDVKLTALGGLSMPGAPLTALTTIPVPSPQPDTAFNNNGAFNGFDIVASPKIPPADNQ